MLASSTMTVRSRRIAATATFGLAVIVGVLLYALGGLSSLERSSLQARFELRGRPRPQGIVVIAIDDRSFAALGQQWPFPRSLHARAVDRLHGAAVKEIVYDVQFSEPTTPSEDLALYDAIGRAGGAVLSATATNGHGDTTIFGGRANLEKINAQAGMAVFSSTSGGAIERVPYSIRGVGSVAVVAAARASGRNPSHAGFSSDGALIDYQGGPGTFPTISFSDLLAGRFNPAVLRGAIAVVGATAPTLQDVHATPTGSRLMSGPELQANSIWTVLHGVPLRAAPGALAVLLIVLLAALPPLVRERARLLSTVIASSGAAIAYAAATQLAFDGGSVLPVVAPLTTLAISLAGTITSGELIEAAERRRLTNQLYEAQLELIYRLSQAAEARDHHTGAHLERIARLTNMLALAAGMSSHDAELLRHASLMHDIGKIGMPDRVLLKPGPLDPEERALMNTHTSIGGDILSDSKSPLVRMAEDVARCHHERWDGTGYPAGLRGEEIPLAGRICAVCDVFDALVTERVYKPPWTVEQAVTELRRLSGHAFDPRLVELFIGLIATFDRDLLGTLAARPTQARRGEPTPEREPQTAGDRS